MFQCLVKYHFVDDSFNFMMYQWNIIFNQEQILEVYCVQHENLWRWWKVSLKHHLHFILRCCDDVKAFWLRQWENCHLSECVCNCISYSFHDLKQFSWELLNILHDLLIFIVLLFSDNLASMLELVFFASSSSQQWFYFLSIKQLLSLSFEQQIHQVCFF